MWELLTLDGGLLFWVVIGALTITELILTSFDRWGWATMCLIVSLIWLGRYHTFNLLQYGAAHPWLLVWWLTLYITVGVVWAISRWVFFLRDLMKELHSARELYATAHGKTEFNSWIYNHYGLDKSTKLKQLDVEPLSFTDYKAEIGVWIYLWPFSIVNKIVGRLPVHIYNTVNRLVENTFNRISRMIWERTPGTKQ